MSDATQQGSDRPLESRLYTFIDSAREFAIYFLEGQQLIHELALLHDVRGAGFNYFRDVVLSVQPMIAFLKHGEQCGFYIDSEAPYFRLKLETTHAGQTRCMLLPDAFQEFPEAMEGLVRVQKLFANARRPPYESVLAIPGLPLRDVVNLVLRDSYQQNSTVLLSRTSDQSVLLHQLPPLKDEYEYSQEAVEAMRAKIRDDVEALFEGSPTEPEDVVNAFSQIGYRFLASRPVRFHCNCSRERVLAGIESIWRREGEALFEAGKSSVDVTCEYCKTTYRVERSELERSGAPPN